MKTMFRTNAPALIVFALAALAGPLLFGGNRFFAFILGMTLIHILWASGMNLLSGYTGLMPLMFAGIAGVSAYASIDLAAAGWSYWLAMPVAIVGAALVGVVLGVPSLRLKGFYFTLCSLVIQTVITLGFVYFARWTNGDTGLSQIPLPNGPGGSPLPATQYELVLAVAAIAGIVIVMALVASSFGRRIIAIREDDVLAETLGTDVTRQKLLAFFIASLFAALGGALYAPYVGFISPRSFDVLLSLNIWLMVAFGGRGTIWGPVIGAALLAPTPYLLQNYYMIKDIIYGLLIIAVVVAMPNGLVSGLKWPGRFTRAKSALPQERVG